MGLYRELVVALAGWAGGRRVQGFLLKRWSLTQLARPGSTDPDPESNGASRRGLLGEAGGQSGKEAPCGFGSCWQRCRGRGYLVFDMGEVLPLKQQKCSSSLFPSARKAFLCAAGTSDGPGAVLGTAVFCRDSHGRCLMPQQTTNLLCSPAWLIKQKYCFVSIFKNSSL